jgi:hypothetical protein
MRKYFKWAAVIFVAFFMVAQPAQAARTAHRAGQKLYTAVQQLSTFIADLPDGHAEVRSSPSSRAVPPT